MDFGKKDGYGYVKVKRTDDYWEEPELRKPTPAEREAMILNFIRDNSGKSMRVKGFAELLAVSDRTIQKILKKLEECGLVKRIKRAGKGGKQYANIIEYIGPDTPRSKLTLARLYNPENPCGFRDWHWEEYKFIPGFFGEHFTKKDCINQGRDLKKRKKLLSEKKAALENKSAEGLPNKK